MYNFLTLFIPTISIFILLISSPSLASKKYRPFNKVYVFGDSYTDTGNTNDSNGPSIFHHVSNLPYGKSFFHHATNRYSDGRLVIDFIAESLNLPFFPPYLNKSADTTHGVNFAVGGCTTIPFSYFVQINSTLDSVPQSLSTQLTWFKDYIKGSGCKDAVSTPTQCKSVFEGALVWLGEISANDYNYIFGTKATSKDVQKLAIKYQTKFIEEILKMGAKHVVVQGLPATGCLPLSFALGAAPSDRDDIGCVGTKNKESYDHNVILQGKINGLRSKYPETIIVYGDDWHAYREVFKNPTKYGFLERFKFETCCGFRGAPNGFNPASTCGAEGTISCKHPSRYMSWDGLHVTQGLNKVISDLFIGGSFAQPSFPYLLKKAAEY
ncbi:GDSL esterase/lipase At3g48460-like [Rutidosis leptorrhynchoides]|uniref:GDSL esterase/lipase At3g48460-like n=1 Tax=Rutidosis leptorrhynchoides TaxID=125765 RepID=UPI003A998274